VRWRVPGDLLGAVDYYRQLASLSPLHLVPYNTQGWPVEIFERLAEIEGIVAVKDPCQNELEFFRAIKRLGDRFLWIGNKRHDPGVLHLRYQMGMQAFTSGPGNFIPEPELEMHEAACRKEWGRVIELQEAVAALERVRDAHDDAAMVKAAMDLIGLKRGRVRPPRRDMPTEDWAALASLLSQLEVLHAPSTVKAL
jgi:dihydrodipicolinate synthase/N-acetylneuraminate lyase